MLIFTRLPAVKAGDAVAPPVRLDALKRLKAVGIVRPLEGAVDTLHFLQFVGQFGQEIRVLGQNRFIRHLVTNASPSHEIEYNASYSLASVEQSIL